MYWKHPSQFAVSYFYISGDFTLVVSPYTVLNCCLIYNLSEVSSLHWIFF